MLVEDLPAFFVADVALKAKLQGQYLRVFPLIIPQHLHGEATKLSCLVYQRLGVERQSTFCGTDGVVRTILQVDSYALKYIDANALARLVRLRLTDFGGTIGDTIVKNAKLDSELELFDDDPGLYRVSQTYSIWHVED